MTFLPQSLKVFKKDSIFFRILVFFILLIMVSILSVGYFSFIKSSGLLLDEVRNSNMILLKQARDSIDQQIQMLDKITLQAAGDRRINSSLHIRNEEWSENILLYQDIKAYLANITSSGNIISGIVLYLNRPDIVLSDQGKYSARLFFGDVCNYEALSYDKWSGLLKENNFFKTLGRFSVRKDSSRFDYITFIRGLPTTEKIPYGSVIINVDKRAFESILNAANEKSHAFINIIDQSGNIMASSKGSDIKGGFSGVWSEICREISAGKTFSQEETFINKKIQGNNYSIAVIKSETYGWRYVAVIPEEFIMAKENIIKDFTVAIIFISLLAGLVLAYFLTRSIYRPINAIIDYINVIKGAGAAKYDEKSKNELVLINRIIDYVYNENESLRDSFNRNIPILRGNFLNNLLDGKLSQPDLQQTLKSLEMYMPFDAFQIVVFELEDSSDRFGRLLEMRDTGLEEIVDKITQDSYHDCMFVYSVRKMNNRLVSLINMAPDFEKPEVVYDFIKDVCDYLSKNYGLTVTSGVGRQYTGLQGITSSYIDALFALKYKRVKGPNAIIHIDEASKITEHFYEYSVEKEKQIINFIKSGDMSAVRDILKGILSENAGDRQITTEMINNLFNALAGTAVRTIYDIQLSVKDIFGDRYNIYDRISGLDRTEDKEVYITEVFEKITCYINSRKKGQNEKIYDKIVVCVNERYHLDISLNMIADLTGLSPSYLSWIFKEVSGMNFVDYLNSVRIEKAKEIMKKTNLPISSIGQKVGFNNSNTFIRVFKKHEGITPGQFKSSC